MKRVQSNVTTLSVSPPTIQKSADHSNGNERNGSDRTSIIFTLKNQIGGLASALRVFQELGINVLHVELNKSGEMCDSADVLVDIECDANRLEQVLRLLKREVQSVNYAAQISSDGPPPTPLSACGSFGKWVGLF